MNYALSTLASLMSTDDLLIHLTRMEGVSLWITHNADHVTGIEIMRAELRTRELPYGLGRVPVETVDKFQALLDSL